MDVRFILFISFPKDFPENIFPLAFDSFRNKFLKRSSLICLGQFAPQVRKFHVEPFHVQHSVIVPVGFLIKKRTADSSKKIFIWSLFKLLFCPQAIIIYHVFPKTAYYHHHLMRHIPRYFSFFLVSSTNYNSIIFQLADDKISHQSRQSPSQFWLPLFPTPNPIRMSDPNKYSHLPPVPFSPSLPLFQPPDARSLGKTIAMP